MPTEKETAPAGQSYQLKDQKPGAELKGAAFTLTVLRLLSNELEAVERDLRGKIAIGPRFFANAPVIVDVERVRTSQPDLDFVALLSLLRELSLVPVGVRNATPAQQEAAIAAGLAVVKGGGIRDLPLAPAREPNDYGAHATPKDVSRGHHDRFPHPGPLPEGEGDQERARRDFHGKEPPMSKDVESSMPVTAPEPPRESPSSVGASKASERVKTIFRPVRSGQQVYAKDSDLIVLAAVNPGAEVVADGNIHVYGPLRGRALAGAQGDRQARVFCLDMEAELVAIAGCYQVDESVPKDIRGLAVQVYLEGDKLRFERMN